MLTDFDDMLGATPFETDLRSEKAIQSDGLRLISALDETLVFQNTTGQAWQGQRAKGRIGDYVKIEPGMVILRAARVVKFGLPGSGDGIGVRRSKGFAVEFKTAIGPQRELQKNFEAAWTKAGGIYVLARTPDEARSKVERATA